MNRLFGKNKNEPTTAELLEKATASSAALSEKNATRVQELQEKINGCLNELRDLQVKMKNPVGGAAAKQKALQVMKKKKMYEQQLAQLDAMSANVDSMAFAMENQQMQLQMVEGLAMQRTVLQQQAKSLNVDKIEGMMEDIQDLMMDQEELSEILTRNYALDGVDEGDLDAEFAALEAEVAMEALDPMPSAPSYLPAATPAAPAAPATAAPITETR